MSEKKSPYFPQGLSPLVYSIELRDLIALSLFPQLYTHFDQHNDTFSMDELCEFAYNAADKMLAAREATREKKGEK